MLGSSPIRFSNLVFKFSGMNWNRVFTKLGSHTIKANVSKIANVADDKETLDAVKS